MAHNTLRASVPHRKSSTKAIQSCSASTLRSITMQTERRASMYLLPSHIRDFLQARTASQSSSRIFREKRRSRVLQTLTTRTILFSSIPTLQDLQLQRCRPASVSTEPRTTSLTEILISPGTVIRSACQLQREMFCSAPRRQATRRRSTSLSRPFSEALHIIRA